MNSNKKSAEKFLEEVIIPIEQNQIDSEKLYLLIDGKPKMEFGSDDATYLQFEDPEPDEYSIPEGNKSGDWQKLEKTSGPTEKLFKLKTLSGIIWHGNKGGNLFRAEHRDKAEKLSLIDFIYFGKPSNDTQRLEIEAQEHIDSCIALGIKAKEIRLLSNVKSWTPYVAWLFSIDCAEHQCAKQKREDATLAIYKKGIVFAYARAKHMCGMGSSQMEELIQSNASRQGFHDLIMKRRGELLTEINNETNKDFTTKYIGKVVATATDFPYNPFALARETRTQNAWNYASEYRDEYEFPGLIARNPDDERLAKRIWYALMKQELDWQVLHLSRLIGE